VRHTFLDVVSKPRVGRGSRSLGPRVYSESTLPDATRALAHRDADALSDGETDAGGPTALPCYSCLREPSLERRQEASRLLGSARGSSSASRLPGTSRGNSWATLPEPQARELQLLRLNRLLSESVRLNQENALLSENRRLAYENEVLRQRCLQAACNTTSAQTATVPPPQACGAASASAEFLRMSNLPSARNPPAAAAGPAPVAEEDPCHRHVFSYTAMPSSGASAPASSFEVPGSGSSDMLEAPTGDQLEVRSTVMLRNLPNNYTRAMLLELLNQEGFAGLYDFVYLPIDFKSRASLGYAFVNLVNCKAVTDFWKSFSGFSRWKLPSRKVCFVSWCGPVQGLDAYIERYRNSPVMHASVPDEYKPTIFLGGVRVPFPPPTKMPRAPRIRNKARQ